MTEENKAFIFKPSTKKGAIGVGGDRKEAKLITPEKAADRLSVSPVTIRKWLREGKLRGIKVFGSGWRVREDEIDKFIDQTEEETL